MADGLERSDTRLDRRGTGKEHTEAPGSAGDSHRAELLWQLARFHSAQALQRADHRPGRAQDLGRTGVGAKLAAPRKPGDHDSGQQPEHDVQDDTRYVVPDSRPLVFV